jgi:hypothetical protein
MMPDNVITHIEQVTPAWLTSVLSSCGALIHGEVIFFDVTQGGGNWSANALLNLRYSEESQGTLPRRLFLKMVNTQMNGESFDPSEVFYYTRDYIGVAGVPLAHCYDAAYSEDLQRYHILMDDLTETHVTAADKAPTLEYGLALAEGLAAMHARWWGAQRFSELGATMHTASHIQSFVNKSVAGAGQILIRFSNELKSHWPDAIRKLSARHPAALIARTKNDHGFTLVHGDVGHHNVLVPRIGNRPIYIIDRQPFDWALTTWLGVFDLVYVMVLDWDVDTRKRFEMPVLKRYYDQLLQNGVIGYSWEKLIEDYRLCAAMGVYVAAEYFSADVKERWVSTTLLMLCRSLTACDDLRCSELW